MLAKEVALAIAKDAPAATKALNALAARGLVERVPAAEAAALRGAVAGTLWRLAESTVGDVHGG